MKLNIKLPSHIDKRGLLHLFVIYFVWSTTYLAIRYGVREGGGFPPFIFGAIRVLLAGSLMLIWGKITQKRLYLEKDELITLIFSGLLLWVCGNGMVLWAEQRIHSGYAALIIGATPIWVSIIESFLNKKLPGLLLIASVMLGFSGLTFLSLPDLLQGNTIDFLSTLALVFGSISWASGSVLQSYRKVRVDPIISSGYQHLFGGVGFVLLTLLLREPKPTPTLEAWLALFYLIFIGSIIAFTSFVMALKYLPVQIVMTYAYVNPILALFLGWVLLKEPITIWVILATVLIISSVYGIFKVKYKN